MRSTRARRLVALSATGLLLAGGAAVGAAGTASATQNGHHSSYDRDYRDGHNRYNHDRGWWNDDGWGRHHHNNWNNWNNWGDNDNYWGGYGHGGYGHNGYGHGGYGHGGGWGGGHGGGWGGGGHGGGGHGGGHGR
ncbi:hypothetical protein ABZ847_19265 [Streptomyces bauhiniae]